MPKDVNFGLHKKTIHIDKIYIDIVRKYVQKQMLIRHSFSLATVGKKTMQNEGAKKFGLWTK